MRQETRQNGHISLSLSCSEKQWCHIFQLAEGQAVCVSRHWRLMPKAANNKDDELNRCGFLLCLITQSYRAATNRSAFHSKCQAHSFFSCKNPPTFTGFPPFSAENGTKKKSRPGDPLLCQMAKSSHNLESVIRKLRNRPEPVGFVSLSLDFVSFEWNTYRSLEIWSKVNKLTLTETI